jgi:hypothetical protein
MYRRVFAFYKEFMFLYFPQEMVFPASLENLTLFIAYCFQKKIEILNCNVRTSNFLTNFIIVGSLEDCLLVIWTTPELSVKNVIHLLLKALPHNCIATTIGNNSRIIIWYFNQSVGHLIQNVATNLIHGSLEKSSKESNRRVFAFYKEFMLLYFPQEMVFPAS